MASLPAVQSLNTTANTPRAVVGLPLANTTGYEAELELVRIGEAQEANNDVNVEILIVAVALGSIPGGGTSMVDIGAGTGLALPVDIWNTRPAIVGASTAIKYAYADSAVTIARTLGRASFPAKAGYVFTEQECRDMVWKANEVLMLLYSHATGTSAFKMDYDLRWKE
jgi:hypothetical protein